MASFNRHHELFTRRDFEANPYTRQLRNHEELIVPMEIEVHQELHENAMHIQPFREDEAKRILEIMDWRSNYLENIERLIKLIDQVVVGRIGELAITSLEKQIPYIKSGAYSLDMNKQPPTKHNKRKSNNKGD